VSAAEPQSAWGPADTRDRDSYREPLVRAPGGGSTPPPPANFPPSVTIFSPGNDSDWSYSEQIPFEASASDPEDGNVSSSLVWTSSIQGQIGTGSLFSRALNPGTHTIVAKATDSKGLGGLSSITINVAGLEPSINLSTQPINFGEVQAGTSVSRIITLVNSGSATLNISSISALPQEFRATPSSVSLAPGQSTSITVTFSPPAKGKAPYTYTGSLFIHHNASNMNSPITIGLQGTKTAAPKGGGKK